MASSATLPPADRSLLRATTGRPATVLFLSGLREGNARLEFVTDADLHQSGEKAASNHGGSRRHVNDGSGADDRCYAANRLEVVQERRDAVQGRPQAAISDRDTQVSAMREAVHVPSPEVKREPSLLQRALCDQLRARLSPQATEGWSHSKGAPYEALLEGEENPYRNRNNVRDGAPRRASCDVEVEYQDETERARHQQIHDVP